MTSDRDDNSALILATMATKSDEVRFLCDRLGEHGVAPTVIDVSLESGGRTLGAGDKTAAIERASARVFDAVNDAMDRGVNAVVGLGGGTGAEIILRVLRAMPITFPKVLITTLPFDPRFALADNSITLVPTLADINGLNATLREILENAAAMIGGLCRTRRKANACVLSPSIGITALGATDRAVRPLVDALRAQGEETTVFHANGFGGAAFMRFAERGAFSAMIDLTPHELTRIMLAGVHVPMDARFTAAPQVPRIVLPGALNFIGLGQKDLVPPDYLRRPHYEHSGFFTHVQLTEDEMAQVARGLAHALNSCVGYRHVIVPMGGFSHHDRPGGDIEGPALREVFLETIRREADAGVTVTALDAHLFDPAVTSAVLGSLEAATDMPKEAAQ
ncbi:MAG: Tm-1-like ATP-binding domain-containing protein [Pseudomonadota bacterium]